MMWLLILFFLSLLVGPLGGISISSGVTIYIHDVFLLVVLVAGLFSLLKTKRFQRPVLFYPIAAFFCIGVVSLLVNYFRFTPGEIVQSSLYLWRWGAYALLYVVLSQQSLSSSFLLFGLFSFGTGLSVLGYVQYVLYPELRNLSYLGWDPHLYRLFSTLLDPNFVGILIVVTVFLGFYLWKTSHYKVVPFLEILNLVALYLTYSRSSYAAFIAGVLAYIIYYKKWNAILFIAVFIIALVYIPKPGGKTLLLRRMDSTVSRIENWQESIRLISASPIIGNGFNTLRFAQHPGMLTEGELVSKAGAGVDSSILFLFATTGVLGVLAYGWIIVKELQFIQKNKSLPEFSGLIIVSITSLMTHSIFVNSLVYPWVVIWMWTLFAAGELLVNAKRKK